MIMDTNNKKNDIMKTKYFIASLLSVLVFFLTIISCATKDELIEELQVARAFAPVGLETFIRNQITVEVDWTPSDDANSYVVQFSRSSNFSNIDRIIEVAGNELPVKETLEGETLYYVRVKAISANGKSDSNWATSTAQTLTEQIFLPQEPGDILATAATLRWAPGNDVTHIEVNPGNISYDITTQEQLDGMATISGLTGETEYSAILYNGTKIRGTATFTTGIDIGDGLLVTAEDDLLQIIADAQSGDILVLDAGDYTAQTSVDPIVIDKSLTIRGLRDYDKPKLSLSFSLVTGAVDVEFIDLDLDGTNTLSDVIRYNDVGSYNSLLVSGCNVHDYVRSFIAGSVTDGNIQSVTVENSVVSNILTSGGDFIDFRSSNVLNVSVTTSTFNNCAPARDFFRIDDAGSLTQNGQICNVLMDSCTLYACSNSDSRRILYIRFQTNDIEVRNTLITDTAVEGFSDQARTDDAIIFNNNNYFNAPTLFDSTVARYDDSGTYTTLDPGFVDAASGDFTITNQDLIDNQVGDPRWRP